MKTQILIILCLIVSIAGMQSCIDPYFPVNNCIKGYGQIVSEEIPLNEFNSVISKTVVDVEIIQGDEQKVIVEGHENMIHELELLVYNGSLKVDLNGGCYNNFSLKVYITIPNIETLKVESTGNIKVGEFDNLETLNLFVDGTGDIVSDGPISVDGLLQIETESTGKINFDVTADEVRAYLDGTGNVTLFGSCNSQFIETEGTANYKAYEFDSEFCDVYSDGVGDVKVFVTKTLDVSINSVGSVYYKGNPQIHVYDDGVGDLKRVN